VCNFDLLFYVLYDVRCRMHVDVRCPPTGMVNRVRLYGLQGFCGGFSAAPVPFA